MANLSAVIADPNKRRAVVDDGVSVIEAEVADKGGLSGLAIKAAFGMVKKVRPGFVGQALNALLDEFAQAVDPIWAECTAKGGDPAATFAAQAPRVSEALLKITDKRAAGASGPVKATYEKLRPEAVKHTVAAMPRVAGLLKKHASA